MFLNSELTLLKHYFLDEDTEKLDKLWKKFENTIKGFKDKTMNLKPK